MADDDSPFDPKDQSFEALYWNRGGEPGRMAAARATLEQFRRAADVRDLRGGYFDPRPDVMARMEDQRGMNAAQLDLQARYLMQHGAYPGLPLDPLSEYRPAWSSSMAQGLGTNELDKVIAAKRTYVPVNKEAKAK